MAPKPGSVEEELEHVQFRIKSFQGQLVGYMDEFDKAVKVREGQQVREDDRMIVGCVYV